MAIALFGGSFDPIHKGHLAVMKQALLKLPITHLVVVPAWRNPHKSSVCAPATLRLAWVRKATKSLSRKIIVTPYEINQNIPVRTIQTIRALKQKYGKITLIIGSDSVKTLPTWAQYRRLRQEVTIVVATRMGHNSVHPYKKLHVKCDISSTQIRRGSSRRFLPSCVAKEIVDYYKGKI